MPSPRNADGTYGPQRLSLDAMRALALLQSEGKHTRQSLGASLGFAPAYAQAIVEALLAEGLCTESKERKQ